MKKVILTCLPSVADYDIFVREDIPPLALYALAPSVRACSLTPIILDPNIYEGESAYNVDMFFEKHIIDYLDDIIAIGFSTNTFNWAITLNVVRYIKNKYPTIPIILGGLHATCFPNYTLNKSGADYVIVGEGEEPIKLLLQAIKTKNIPHQIKGLVCAEANISDLNYNLLPLEEFKLLPPPAFDLLPNGSYDTMPLESSRGCLHSCVFCSIPHRRNWRGLDVDTLLKRVTYAKQFLFKFKNQNVINFTDDCFTQDIERAKIVLNKLAEQGNGVKYFIEARVSNLLKDNLIEFIPYDIIASMQIGVECGYNDGLRLVKKGTTVERVYECVKRLYEVGLNKKAFLSFIIGFPWEGEKEIYKTIETVIDIVDKYKIRCIVNWLIFLPSDLWNEKEKYSINVSEELYDQFQWNNSKETFLKCHPKIDENAYMRISKTLLALQADKQFLEYHHPIFYNKTAEMQFKRINDSENLTDV